MNDKKIENIGITHQSALKYGRTSYSEWDRKVASSHLLNSIDDIPIITK